MKTQTLSFYASAVTRVVARITGSLDDALDLNELACGARLSPFHFHRIFRGMTGETPLEMHRCLRLERAATCLAASTASVTRIAFDTGYDTHEAFQCLGAIVEPAGLIRPDALMLGIYHDDPEVTPAEQLRSDAALRNI